MTHQPRAESDMNASGDPSEHVSATARSILRLNREGLSAATDVVAVEEPLEIQLNYEKPGGLRVTRSAAITMRTPGHDPELAAGFLFTEGILSERDQLEAIRGAVSPDAPPGTSHAMQVVLRAGVAVDLKPLERNFYTTSSCGVCGKASLAALQFGGRGILPADGPLLEGATIRRLPEILRETQTVFDQTGGLHAAGLFDFAGNLRCVREDVGRHNAVDKVIGERFLAGETPLSRSILLVSGRASFELMQKALMAGIPVLAAVGAPSSLAVDVARRFGATLIGFLRDGRFNLYAGAQRLRECGAAVTQP